jgi:aryl-alcohol dehydrogenase-like predicted oxidoreductase
MQFGWTTDEPTSRAVMDSFAEAGGNFIDTADIYTNWAGDLSYGGKTEEIIGRWLTDKGVRQDIVLATKARGRMWEGPNGEGLSRAHIIRACEDSLRRLQTDYIDLYQCHWADLDTPIEETLSALDDLMHAGKVRYIGASNYPAWRLMEAVSTSEKRGYVRFDCYQPEYSLMERQLFEYEAMPFCKHYQLGVIPTRLWQVDSSRASIVEIALSPRVPALKAICRITATSVDGPSLMHWRKSEENTINR